MCMMELGELEKQHEEFDRRHVRLLAVSLEEPADAAKSKEQFSHLHFIADANGDLIKAAGVLHEHAGPGGKDCATPFTVLVDREGMVRWLHRPSSGMERISTKELLTQVDAALGR